MSETKTSFAERTLRSLKYTLYRYMKDHGYKYIHKMTHIVATLIYKRNCSIVLKSNSAKNPYFLSFLDSKSLRDFRKTTCRIGDSVRIWEYNLRFRKGYKPQFKQEVFEMIANSSRKPPTYTKQDEQDEII